MLADLHTHSIFSFDGKPGATPDNMAQTAIARGITHLAVTDHCDIDGELQGIYRIPDRDELYEALMKAKKDYGDRLTILFGIELGQAHVCPDAARALLERYPYDIVLGSLHNLRGERDFYFFDYNAYTGEQLEKLFDRVLDETLEICGFPGIDVITHLSYIERYMARAGLALDYTRHLEKLEQLFERIIARELVLEVNTSDLASGYCLPPSPVLSLYRECGGTRICLGSDAHEPGAIGRNFDTAREMLLSLGFTELTIPRIGQYPIK